MGFSDLLTSSRGPGVIGTLLALLVLVGFGTLYIFVFDEGLQGGKKTIQAVIRDQALEIETHKVQIENAKKRIEDGVRYKAQGKEADDLKLRAGLSAEKIAELTSTKTAAESAITTANEAWEKYKEEYRASEWATAKGEKLEDIKTSSGEVYTNVVISEVDHTGMRISHSAGSKTIPPKDLPADIHDRFQFSEEKTEAKREEIDKDFAELGQGVEVAALAKKGQDKLVRIGELKDAIVDANTKIQSCKATEPGLMRQVDGIQMELAKEQQKAANRSARGGQGINRTPQIKARLSRAQGDITANRRQISESDRAITNYKREIATLQREVDQIKIDIAKLKKEIAAKQAPVPQP